MRGVAPHAPNLGRTANNSSGGHCVPVGTHDLAGDTVPEHVISRVGVTRSYAHASVRDQLSGHMGQVAR